MVKIDNIGHLKECRIWLEELPLIKGEVVEVLSSILETSNSRRRSHQNIAVELFVAPRYYALLGIEYIYAKTGCLEVRVNITDRVQGVSIDSLALSSENVHLGISKEYSQTILNTSLKLLMNFNDIPSGIILFSFGSYSDYGSNQVIFAKVTSILIKLFMGSQKNVELEGLKNIVRTELQRRLIDI